MRLFLTMFAMFFAATTGWGIYAVREDAWGVQGYEISLIITGFVVPVAAAAFTLCLMQYRRPIRWFDRRADARLRCVCAGLAAGLAAWTSAMLLAWLVAQYASVDLAAKLLPHDAIAAGLCSGLAVLGAGAVLPKAREGHCVACGQDLSVTDRGRCTECGEFGTRYFSSRRVHKKTGTAAEPPRSMN